MMMSFLLRREEEECVVAKNHLSVKLLSSVHAHFMYCVVPPWRTRGESSWQERKEEERVNSRRKEKGK